MTWFLEVSLVYRFEELSALDGGTDGMSIIKEILKMASYILKNCG